MTKITVPLLVAALAFGAVVADGMLRPDVVEAQGIRGTRIGTPHNGDRPFELDLHAGFVWFGAGLATGARFGIPIVDNGFVSAINNAVYINFGADLYYFSYRDRRNNRFYGAGLAFPVAMQWDFYFTEHWSAFGEIGVNFFFFHPRYFRDDDFFLDARHWFLLAVGGRFHFNEVVSLTLRLGSPYASFGVSLFF